MRRFKSANLDVRDIDFERRLIDIREGKGGKAQTIPATEDLLGDLKHLLGKHRKEAVFTNPSGDKLTVRQINNIIARPGQRAGIQNPNP